MQMLHRSYEGLDLLIRLNVDRVLFVGAISIAIFAGVWIGSLL